MRGGEREDARIGHVEELARRASHAVVHAAEELFTLPGPPPSRWHRAGVSRRGERVFDVVSGIVLALFVAGWSWSIAAAHAADDRTPRGVTPATARIAAALTTPGTPSAAYLTDLALDALAPLRGASGKLRARIQAADAPLAGDSLPAGARLAYGSATDSAAPAPTHPGIWRLAVRVGSRMKPVGDFTVISLVPPSAKRRGRIGLYYIGSWPGEKRGVAPRPGYAPPSGFIEVTRENQETRVSEHFRLRDFLTKGQERVWPKYLVLREELVDKLELVLADLAAHGHRVEGVRVMSGFRTPQYNAAGGDTRGRAGLSRHMYGDAADVYIDHDGSGWMDDLNGDGRVNLDDARVIQDAVDRVEAAHPALVGGTGVYVAGSGHGPFIHIDTRGYRARWVGTGDD